MALLIACQAIAYIDRVNLSVAAPVLIKNHGYTAASIGLLFSIFNWVFTIAILFAGPFVDRLRARVAYGVGASAWSVGTILSGVSTAFVPLALARARRHRRGADDPGRAACDSRIVSTCRAHARGRRVLRGQ
jgi:sugar phosphate permease